MAEIPSGTSMMIFLFNRQGQTSCRTVVVQEAVFGDKVIVMEVVAEDGNRERITLESLT